LNKKVQSSYYEIIIANFIFPLSICRPKSVPNSPSVQRAFSNLRHQLTSAWSSHSSKKKAEQTHLTPEDKKKWPSAHDCSGSLIPKLETTSYCFLLNGSFI
jgi:hypothetical protein